MDGVYRTLLDEERMQAGRGYLLWTRRGAAARLLETYALKLDLLLQCFQLTRDFVREEQLPFLNLTPESFRVRLAQTGPALPFFWTARAEVARPGAAVELSVQGGQGRYFTSPSPGSLSAYRPGAETRLLNATGSVRLREVTFGEGGTVIIEGTISHSGKSGGPGQ